jgi:hypothetical protein
MPQEIAVNTLPFWSRFTVTADLRFDGVSLLRTLLQPGANRPVFDYRKGELASTALEGVPATARDTILVTANQTRGGGLFRIHGLSITKDGWAYEQDTAKGKGLRHTNYPPNSAQPGNGGFGPQVLTVEDWRGLDSYMAHLLTDNFRVQINVDGTRRILEMGPVPLYPGVGGVVSGSLDSTNGQAFVSNYMAIQEGIVWNPAGAVDSNIVVNIENTYQVDVPTWTAPDGLAPDGTPIPAAIPTPMGRVWTQGWIVNFHGYEESPTSNVS